MSESAYRSATSSATGPRQKRRSKRPSARNAAWYLDQIEDAVGHPQEANELVTELTGAPAQSVVQWAAQNAELFR